MKHTEHLNEMARLVTESIKLVQLFEESTELAKGTEAERKYLDGQNEAIKTLCSNTNQFVKDLKNYKLLFEYNNLPQNFLRKEGKSAATTTQQDYDTQEMDAIRSNGQFEVSMIITPAA